MSCYCCQHPTKEVIKYHDKEFCEECLNLLHEVTPKIMNVYYEEDCTEEIL
jgi:hypothetical protein